MIVNYIDHYTRSRRIAIVLTGNQKIAKDVTEKLLKQSTRIADRWQDDADVARWFARHTIILSRDLVQGHFDPASDPLITTTADPTFQIILRTLRFLPQQHREAYFLAHGENFDLHQLASAMDCSTQAAANHLVAATTALAPVSAGRLNDFNSALPGFLVKLNPSEQTLSIEIDRLIRKQPRSKLRIIALSLAIAIVAAALAYLVLRFYKMLVI